MKPEQNNLRASWGCAIHSLLLSVTLWAAIAGWHGFSESAYRLARTIWLILLFAWPTCGFILWRAANGNIRRLLPAFLAGFLLLCPAFFLLFILPALRHTKHI
jgi:hypothetical protein